MRVLKRSLREGVRHCTPSLCCNLSRPRLRGRCRGVSRDGRGITCGTWHLRAVPLSATHFVRVHFPRTRGQLLGGVTASLPCRGRWMRVQRAAVGNKKRSTSEYLDKASNDVPEKYVQDVQRRSASVDNMPQISFECQAVLSYSITGHQ